MIIPAPNVHIVHPPKSALGFVNDTFEFSVLDGRWKSLSHKAPAPTHSLVTEGGQRSIEIAHPAGTRYDANQSIIEGLVVYQDVVAGESFEAIAKVVYPDLTFSSTNSMYLGTGIIFYYDANNYVWIEAQAHPSVGARIRWAVNDDTSGASSSTSTSPGFTIPVTPIYLKIKSTSNDFLVYASDDDSTYYLMATLTAVNLKTNGNKLGVTASTYRSVEAGVVAWEAYFREMKEILSV